MDIGLELIVGLVVGAVVAYVIASFLHKKANQKAVEEGNRQADLAVQEARLTAKRLTDEASVQADKNILNNAKITNFVIQLFMPRR